MTDFKVSEPMKYWATSSTMSAEEKRIRLEKMASDGAYIWSEKFDGNWSRGIVSPDCNLLQTRGISKKTGTYGEIQDKVFFWDDVVKAFQNGTTVILGEVYLPGGIDKDCGSILRCLSNKARERQKDKKLEWRIFDVLAYDGVELINEPIEKRITYIPKVVSRINNSLVKGIEYHEMDSNFFDEINAIFAKGGEGAICFKKTAIYVPGKRGPSAWESVKVKQEIENEIDCIITGTEPAIKNYTGKDVEHWELWQNSRTRELVRGLYYGEYALGGPYEPVSKGYFYKLPGAIWVSVYDNNHNLRPLCKVSGLTDEFKTQLRDNFEEWKGCPVSIGGMMISLARENQANELGISIRHPYLKSIRKEDIDPEDCTLAKILAQ